LELLSVKFKIVKQFLDYFNWRSSFRVAFFDE
jgi:hypothetical protein